ncbi:MAG: adenosylcobinamide-phosphate synthase CbiB [Sideroxydans sp.]|nr:adenosylcobinamide-phosphate synthase CbiB [Sideroxydans sp.]
MMLATPLTVLAAVLLDALLGEPRRFHPLAGLGNWARRIEKLCYPSNALRDTRLYLLGIAAVFLAISPFFLLALWLQSLPVLGVIFSVLLLYFCIAPRSLREHAMRVFAALKSADLATARLAVSMMVSRDTTQLNENSVAKATVESVLENGNDAIFAALFWYVVAGLPGVILYRLSNTLDAMWGYRNARYNYFGWAAARLDDVLNFIPARLTSLSYAMLGKTRSALHCWRTQAPLWDSPNAGPVMASGAGALQVKLGGAAIYHGVSEARPLLGCGAEVAAGDIARAVALVQRVLWLWVALIFAASGAWELAHA